VVLTCTAGRASRARLPPTLRARALVAQFVGADPGEYVVSRQKHLRRPTCSRTVSPRSTTWSGLAHRTPHDLPIARGAGRARRVPGRRWTKKIRPPVGAPHRPRAPGCDQRREQRHRLHQPGAAPGAQSARRRRPDPRRRGAIGPPSPDPHGTPGRPRAFRLFGALRPKLYAPFGSAR
jgi:hypothetical protein